MTTKRSLTLLHPSQTLGPQREALGLDESSSPSSSGPSDQLQEVEASRLQEECSKLQEVVHKMVTPRSVFLSRCRFTSGFWSFGWLGVFVFLLRVLW